MFFWCSLAAIRMLNSSRKSALVMPFLALVATVFAALTVIGTDRVAEAQDARSISDGLTLVAIDMSLTELEDIEAAQLAANLVVTNVDRGLIFVGRYSEHAADPREFSSVDEAKSAINEIAEELKANAGATPLPANMSELLEHYSLFIEQFGAFGEGQMFVLSAGRFTFPESGGVDGLAALSGDLAAQGVTVNSISLATTPTEDRDVLAGISHAGRRYSIRHRFP